MQTLAWSTGTEISPVNDNNKGHGAFYILTEEVSEEVRGVRGEAADVRADGGQVLGGRLGHVGRRRKGRVGADEAGRLSVT